MKKEFYLISWCDDNHEPCYWLNENLLGVSMDIIVESIIDLGIPKGTEIKEINITGDTFPEDNWEELFDYFQMMPKLDETDVRLIVADKWKEFYNKNIFKKVLTK